MQQPHDVPSPVLLCLSPCPSRRVVGLSAWGCFGVIPSPSLSFTLSVSLVFSSRTFSTTGSDSVWPMVTLSRSGIRQRRGYQWGDGDWAEWKCRGSDGPSRVFPAVGSCAAWMMTSEREGKKDLPSR